jgi:hypothetical protein
MAAYNTNPKEKTAELLRRNEKLCVFGRIGGEFNWAYVYDDSEEATAACVLWVEEGVILEPQWKREEEAKR